MPLRADFKLFLDGDEIQSSKESYDLLVQFDVAALPQERLRALSEVTDEPWAARDGMLASPSFPSGVQGEVVVTRRSLHEGKSADLRRSHGFFVRVRERLVNTEDPLFGLQPLSYKTFNRFRADVEADDLDAAVTAPREGVELTSGLGAKCESLLSELFYEARARYERWEAEQVAKEKTKREDVFNYVHPRLVERPVADALIAEAGERFGDEDRASPGTEADEGWFYLDVPEGTDLNALAACCTATSVRRPTATSSYSLVAAGASWSSTRRLPSFE